MVKINKFNTKGEKQTAAKVSAEIFAADVNKRLVAQAVRIFLANQRQAGAKTKNRSDVIGSRKKIWAQKGTGRARHGDRYAPIFVGGGVAHGPTGEQNFKKKMPKKMRRKALFAALSSKLADGEIVIINDLEDLKPKTKKMEKILKKILEEGFKVKSDEKQKKVTLVMPKVIENIILAGRNIPYLKFLQAKQLNTYQVLNTDYLIIMESSLEIIEQNYLGDKAK
jgi:large subunit ribosomal protein L4